MKETKFRAIHKLTKKKWTNEELVFHNGAWYEDWRAFEDGTPLNMSQCAVMQYTGLKDKNGVEIYEGDYIEASWGNVYEDRYSPTSIYLGSVKFGEYKQDGSGGEYGGESCLGFYGSFLLEADRDREFTEIRLWDYEREQSLLKFDEIEVIGNIYENPELLDI